MPEEKTQPKKLGIDMVKDAPRLLEGRYGTDDTCNTWGTDANTYEAIMHSQISGLDVLREISPENVPEKYYVALKKTANLDVVKPARIRELEDKTGHDVVAVNTGWGEEADKIEPGASSLINLIRTSADSTETAKAIRCKKSFEIIADSVENLRDITLEKSREWIDKPHIDQTHLYDALPTVAGRPFSFFAEMLQSDLEFIDFVYNNSLYAKWADATGNHHSATTLGIDGMKLQEEYAKSLGLRCMTAPAQIPGREFNADVMYALARTAGTLENLGQYIAFGYGSDADIFIDMNPKKRKGSSAMPHKDIKGGNRTAEEQTESLAATMLGKLGTAVKTIKFRYGRDLSGSASDRLDIGPAFKFVDHVTRRLAEVVYYLGLDEERSIERVGRSFGVVTAEQVMTYLVSPAMTRNPMPRKDAHNLVAELATAAYKGKRPFYDVLSENKEVTSRIVPAVLKDITDPIIYIGQSKEIIETNYNRLHKTKTLKLF